MDASGSRKSVTHLLQASLLEEGYKKQRNSPSFFVILALVQVVCLLGFFLYAEVPERGHYGANTAANMQLYNYFIGVTIMMFVGFGFLMAVLRWYGVGAVGLTMLITAVGLEVAVLVEPLVKNGWEKFPVDMRALLVGDFAVAAILISFGGLIGRANPIQLVVLTVIEVFCYCANKHCFLGKLDGFEDGGGILVKAGNLGVEFEHLCLSTKHIYLYRIRRGGSGRMIRLIIMPSSGFRKPKFSNKIIGNCSSHTIRCNYHPRFRDLYFGLLLDIHFLVP